MQTFSAKTRKISKQCWKAGQPVQTQEWVPRGQMSENSRKDKFPGGGGATTVSGAQQMSREKNNEWKLTTFAAFIVALYVQ